MIAIVSDETEQPSGLAVSAALCVDQDAFDRLGRALRHLAVGLVDEAIHLRLLSSDRRVERLSLGPIQTLIHQPFRWPWTGRRIESVLEALAPQPPTVVHALSAGSYRLAGALAEVYDADLVVQVTSLADCDGIAELNDKRTAMFLAFSEPLVRVLEEQLKAPPEQIELIRPGVLASKRISCFSRPEHATTVLCTSAFERGSGVNRLIEAVDILRKRDHEMLVFLLGSGPHESALRKMVRDRGLSSWITIAQPLGDPADAMQSADLFVRPSADTAFTVDALLAMGAGAAVVSFPSAVCDFLRNSETAVLCSEPTARSLADAIEALHSDHDYARQIASAAMEYVRSNHSMSGMSERTAAVYRKLALARATFPITE